MFQYSLTGKDGSGSDFGSWKTVPAVPVPLSVSGKTVPTVPVSGSSSVPEPPCYSRSREIINVKARFSGSVDLAAKLASSDLTLAEHLWVNFSFCFSKESKTPLRPKNTKYPCKIHLEISLKNSLGFLQKAFS